MKPAETRVIVMKEMRGGFWRRRVVSPLVSEEGAGQYVVTPRLRQECAATSSSSVSDGEGNARMPEGGGGGERRYLASLRLREFIRRRCFEKASAAKLVRGDESELRGGKVRGIRARRRGREGEIFGINKGSWED